jgi:hypothetical protein
MGKGEGLFTEKEFFRWIEDWWEARLEYPWILDIQNEPKGEETNDLQVNMIPHIGRHKSTKWNSFPDFYNKYNLTIYLFKETMDKNQSKLLVNAVDIVSKIRNLSTKESLAFMIHLYIIFSDLRRYVEDENSILNGELYESWPHTLPKAQSEILDVFFAFIKLPYFTVNSLLEFWQHTGVHYLGKYNKDTPPTIIESSYLMIPPNLLTLNELKEIHGESYIPPKITIQVDATKAPVVNNLLETFDQIVLTNQAKAFKEQKRNLVSFPRIEGLQWSEVTFEFVSKDSVRISARNESKRYTFAELGFKDGRKGDLPNILWDCLYLDFAPNHGEVTHRTNIDPNRKRQLKTIVKRLRPLLKKIMNIDTDPFQPYQRERAYKTKFSIEDFSYGK